MAKLTAQQANALAGNFLGLAQAIGDFRYANWDKLTKTENQKIGDSQWSILNYGEDILALSTALVMDEVQATLQQIDDITIQIKGTVHKLKNIQKGINIAASIVTLGASIISQNPKSIAGSITGVVEACSAKA
ncbi:MAG TPA: hypothetical protein PLL90_08865 [Bacteroidales bacterium]|nr:hypothetical protein [Bacteroidales bacterium]